jgi:glycosyltransferase involved in cell wall biosynthesis
MKFSIVIPVRDGAQYLAEAIRSALAQVRPADEVLVLDDNSQDSSAAIAKSSEWGNRVKYFWNQTPTGFADAWNRAAKIATGEFVAILHQDDLLDPEYLLAMGGALERFPKVRHLYAACRYIDGCGNVLSAGPQPHSDEPVFYAGREYSRRYLFSVRQNKHIHRCPGVVTERALLLERCSYRNEAGHIADDDFFYRVGAFTDVVGVPRPLASYREHATSVTGRARLLSITLARDYLFQLKCRAERAGYFEATDEEVFETLAAGRLNESLYYTLRDRCSEWREVLQLANELEKQAPGALARHLKFYERLVWRAARAGRADVGFLYVSILDSYRNLKGRAGRFLKRACKPKRINTAGAIDCR